MTTSIVEEHLEMLSMADTHLGIEALARILFGLKKLVSLPKVYFVEHVRQTSKQQKSLKRLKKND
jgi:hypothetical protein